MSLLQRIRSFFARAKPAPAVPQVPLLSVSLISEEMVRRMKEDTIFRRMIADSEYGHRGSATPPVRADKIKISRPVATRPERDAPYKREEDSVVPFLAGAAAYEFVAQHSTPDPTPTFDAGGGDFGGGGASGSWSE